MTFSLWGGPLGTETEEKEAGRGGGAAFSAASDTAKESELRLPTEL